MKRNVRMRGIDPQIFTIYAALFSVIGNLCALASLIISYRRRSDSGGAETFFETEIL
jgi:ABC-type xylose transport system permease subunit